MKALMEVEACEETEIVIKQEMFMIKTSECRINFNKTNPRLFQLGYFN